VKIASPQTVCWRSASGSSCFPPPASPSRSSAERWRSWQSAVGYSAPVCGI